MLRFLILALLHFHANALSPLSFPRQVSTLKWTLINTALNHKVGIKNRIQLKAGRPGDELFPEKGSSYVPSGLTKEEYDKIKKKEKESLLKMNFGMWGPRFKQSSRPEGDWMVQPGLWTLGFGVNSKKDSMGGDLVESGPVAEWINFAQRHAVSFFSILTLTQYLQYAVVLAVSFFTGPKGLSISFEAPAVKEVIRNVLKLVYGNWKMLILKLITAGFLACPMEIFVMERLNRQRLWSKKKTFWTLSGFGLLSLVSWFGILSGISYVLPA